MSRYWRKLKNFLLRVLVAHRLDGDRTLFRHPGTLDLFFFNWTDAIIYSLHQSPAVFVENMPYTFKLQECCGEVVGYYGF